MGTRGTREIEIHVCINEEHIDALKKNFEVLAKKYGLNWYVRDCA